MAPLLVVASVLLRGVVRVGLEAERSEGFWRRLFGGGRDERGVCSDKREAPHMPLRLEGR